MPAMLQVDSLRKSYTGRAGELLVLRDINLSLNAGQSAAVMGPSGSGKSTLLHILGTLERPDAGRVRLQDADPFALSEPELAVFRNQRVGFIFQDHHLLPQCSVLENVLLPTLATPGGDDGDELVARARQLLDRVGLGERLEHRPAELSGGERQRAAIARALIRKPALLLADEPTGNLDRRNADAVAALLLEVFREAGAVLVVVTHSERLAEQFDLRRELLDGTLVDG